MLTLTAKSWALTVYIALNQGKTGKKPPLLETVDNDDGGIYSLEVSKVGVGNQRYQLAYHCQNASHSHSAKPR